MYTYIRISPRSCVSLPPSLSHPFRWTQSTKLISLSYAADLPELCSCFPLAIYFTSGSVYMSMPLCHFIPPSPSPSLCPQVHSLCLRLYSCLPLGSSEQYIYIFFSFFSDSIHMCQCMVFVFLFLTYFTLYDSLYVHPRH